MVVSLHTVSQRSQQDMGCKERKTQEQAYMEDTARRAPANLNTTAAYRCWAFSMQSSDEVNFGCLRK